MQYGMAIDLQKCMGCQTCATSCKLANNLPIGNWWNKIETTGGATLDTVAGTYPDCSLQHYPVACQHCKAPACVAVCPTGASSKDDETGIVSIDGEVCIGCKSCIEACPYNVRMYNESELYYTLDFAVGNDDAPLHYENTVEKCVMCKNLVEQGIEPMCVQACVGYARVFGDIDDPESEVSKLIASREHEFLLGDELHMSPSVYYLK